MAVEHRAPIANAGRIEAERARGDSRARVVKDSTHRGSRDRGAPDTGEDRDGPRVDDRRAHDLRRAPRPGVTHTGAAPRNFAQRPLSGHSDQNTNGRPFSGRP